jgi:hypothetical protein
LQGALPLLPRRRLLAPDHEADANGRDQQAGTGEPDGRRQPVEQHL